MDVSQIIPYLAVWGAGLSTYVFIQSQIDRLRRRQSETTATIDIDFSPTVVQDIDYADRSYYNIKRPYYPFRFLVTNHSSFDVQLTSAVVLIWECPDIDIAVNFQGNWKSHPSLGMGFRELGNNGEPSGAITLGSRRQVFMLPLTQNYFIDSIDRMRLGPSLILIPRLQTAVDGQFQGRAVGPHTMNVHFEHIMGFEASRDRQRILRRRQPG